MKRIEDIFDRMDLWRHLPSYQLERRADLYFSLYLPEVLSRYLDIPIKSDVIPEFPIRIGTINRKDDDEKSYKVDYVALSEDGRTAVLVELKTEMRSKRDEQNDYLVAASNILFSSLIEGIKTIFTKTTLKRKYYCLLQHLENLGQIAIPQRMKTIIARPKLQGISKASEGIDVKSEVTETILVYVQPRLDPLKDSHGIITFEDFRTVVEEYADPISQRFARSLEEWAKIKAGGNGI